jgi:hypothetical protein
MGVAEAPFHFGAKGRSVMTFHAKRKFGAGSLGTRAWATPHATTCLAIRPCSLPEPITQTRYCELVGIHHETLARWIKEDVLRPRRENARGYVQYEFSQQDVEVGRRLIEILRTRTGQFALWEAAKIARGDMPEPMQRRAPGPIREP